MFKVVYKKTGFIHIFDQLLIKLNEKPTFLPKK